MEKNFTPLLDEHLDAIAGMKEAATDDFFYTRLKARMEGPQPGWSLPLKPAWVIGILATLLVMNGMILLRRGEKTGVQKENSSSLQDFAKAYDQTISTSF